MAENGRPVGDKTTITATQWEAAALASAALTGGFAFFGILWMIGWIGGVPDSPDELRARAQVFTAGFASLAAVVTFCTVAWRAKVTERQASAQERQLESADENNLAVLLQKGAELLSDEDEGKVAAGIACLEAVVTAQNRRFGTQAMNLLAKYIERKHNSALGHYLCKAAITAPRLGELNRNIAELQISLSASNEHTQWSVIQGVREVFYHGGSCTNPTLGSSDDTPNNAIFFETNIQRTRIGLRHDSFIACSFNSCGIEWADIDALGTNQFRNCDFSGAKLRTLLGNFKIEQFNNDGRNYFRRGHPPVIEASDTETPIDPSTIFQVHD